MKQINVTVTTKIGTNTVIFKTDKEANDFLEKLNKDKLQTLFNLSGGVGKFTPGKYIVNYKKPYIEKSKPTYKDKEMKLKPLYDQMARLSEDFKVAVSIETIK